MPTPLASPLPAWAAQLADKERTACASGPGAAELAAIGRDAATESVNSAIKDCRGDQGGGGDQGKAKGKH